MVGWAFLDERLPVLSDFQTIDNPAQVFLRLCPADTVGVGPTFLAPPRHEDIEVQFHKKRKAREISTSVAFPKKYGFPFPALNPDRITGKQKVVFAIVP